MYAILAHSGMYVHGKGGGMVVLTPDRALARGFPTELAAQRFIDLYADAGYGLSGEDARVITLGTPLPVTKVTK